MGRLRADAGTLLTLLVDGSNLRGRLEALVDRGGAAALARWVHTIEAAREHPIDATRHGCQAMKFALTAAERATLEGAMKPAVVTLEVAAREVTRAYLEAIAKRDLAAWRLLELPFMRAGDSDEASFAAGRRRWVNEAKDIDPRDREMVIADLTLDICESRVHLTLGRDATQRDASLELCWEAESGRWYPCRPLTRWSAKAMIRP